MESSRSQVAKTKAEFDGEALIKAVEVGNINEVTKLLRKGANINYVHRRILSNGNQFALTPLAAAAKRGHAEVAKFLINRKANVNLAEPCRGWTGLHYASGNGKVEMIELLMSHGANHMRDDVGKTPLHLAASKGHCDAIICLLNHGADINAADEGGNTPLMEAATENHLPVVELLLVRGADPNLVDTIGNSALHAASYNGRMEVVQRLLLDAGAQVNLANACATPLQGASSRGHLEIVKYLVDKGADINCKINDEFSALTIAARRGHFNVVKFLVLKGADLNATDNNDGFSALTNAASHGHFNVVKFLVLKGADLSAADRHGWTALDHAVSNGWTAVSGFLVRSGSRFELYGTAMRKCKFCGKIKERITVCKGCCSTFYCDKECAANDWYQGEAERHQLHCRRIKEKREEYIERLMEEAVEKDRKSNEGAITLESLSTRAEGALALQERASEAHGQAQNI